MVRSSVSYYLTAAYAPSLLDACGVSESAPIARPAVCVSLTEPADAGLALQPPDRKAESEPSVERGEPTRQPVRPARHSKTISPTTHGHRRRRLDDSALRRGTIERAPDYARTTTTAASLSTRNERAPPARRRFPTWSVFVANGCQAHGHAALPLTDSLFDAPTLRSQQTCSRSRRRGSFPMGL